MKYSKKASFDIRFIAMKASSHLKLARHEIGLYLIDFVIGFLVASFVYGFFFLVYKVQIDSLSKNNPFYYFQLYYIHTKTFSVVTS